MARLRHVRVWTRSWSGRAMIVSFSVMLAGVSTGSLPAAAVPSPCITFLGVAAGGDHSLGIGTNGTVFSWGWDGGGDTPRLGLLAESSNPVPVAGLSGITKVAAGDWYSLALGAGGTVWGWGYNNDGQLGDGTGISRRMPVAVPGLVGVTDIAAGGGLFYEHALAVGTSGTVWAWGSNLAGALGDGTTITRYSPVQVPGLSGTVAVAAGTVHSLALRADGTVWAWGYNHDGELGDGTTTSRLTPVQVPGLSGITSIAIGLDYSFAFGAGGVVWAWGSNQLSPLQVSGLSGVRAIDGWLALATNGSVSTLDRNLNLTPVPGLSDISAIAAGSYHALALGADGVLWSWGSNFEGQLGDGTEVNRPSPVKVTGCSPLSPTIFDGTGGYPSDDCATGEAIVDGYVGDTYLRIRAKAVDADLRWVCFRVDGPAINIGGKLAISGPSASIGGTPSTDGDAAACSIANQASAPVAGHIGDPSFPLTYVPYSFDVHLATTETWMCLTVGPVRQRVIVPAGVRTTPPSIGLWLDEPGPHVPNSTA